MNKTVFRIGLLIFGLMVLGAAGYAYSEYTYWNSPWGAEEDYYLVDFPTGDTGRNIAEKLYEKGIIRNITTFLILADLRGFADKLRAGEYEFRGDETPYEILTKMAEGTHFRHKVVIPEGWTELQILDRYDELGITPREELKDLFDTTNTFAHVMVTAPNGANAKLEGALFPDTYELEKRTPAVKIIDRHLKRFDEVWDEIAEEVGEDAGPFWWESDPDSFSLEDAHKVVVLASIIEKEAKTDEDRMNMASAFLNRINKNMPLQSDATVHYALGDWAKKLTLNDLEIDSPYNTYKNPGLPPAAICNPGKASLLAAYNPPETDYLYFITMPDGITRFTGDYNEFLRWKRERKETLAGQ